MSLRCREWRPILASHIIGSFQPGYVWIGADPLSRSRSQTCAIGSGEYAGAVGMAVELTHERIEPSEGRVDGSDGLLSPVDHLSADDVGELFPAA